MLRNKNPINVKARAWNNWNKVIFVFYAIFRCLVVRRIMRRDRRVEMRGGWCFHFPFSHGHPREMCSGTFLAKSNNFFSVHIDGCGVAMDCSSTAGAARDFLAYVGMQRISNDMSIGNIASWILRSVWLSLGDFAVEWIVYDLTFSLRII